MMGGGGNSNGAGGGGGMRYARRQARDPGLGMTFTMPAYSHVFLGATSVDVSDGDKIVLPASVLNRLTSVYVMHAMPSPLIFEIRNQQTGRQSHCGVLEFTSPMEQVRCRLFILCMFPLFFLLLLPTTPLSHLARIRVQSPMEQLRLGRF
jgi:hypothetical protein